MIWCAPLNRRPDAFTTLNVYVAGYGNDDVASVPVGYGTLIPDPSSPISGILHESDVHGTPRAPADHRLFRIMSPRFKRVHMKRSKRLLRSIWALLSRLCLSTSGCVPFHPIHPVMASLPEESVDFTRAGWCFSGVSVTHVVAEAERIADHF